MGTWMGQGLVGPGAPGQPLTSLLLQSWSGIQRGMLGVLDPQGKRQPRHQGLLVSFVATGAPRATDKALR
jgi:hypothetical protein